MHCKTFIKEIFESVQGEGPYIGVNQLFIRFGKCNLNCFYCDTDFKTDLKVYTAETLYTIVKNYKNIHSISLTGGEPLMETAFLSEFLPLLNKPVYLETNGTLYDNLKQIIQYIDIISMDIKLPSCSKMSDLFNEHKNFIKIAVENNKEIFLKMVFDENITDEEINKTIEIAQINNLLIILQPKMDGEILKLSSSTIYKVFYNIISKYNNVRLIPQVHKFLNIK